MRVTRLCALAAVFAAMVSAATAGTITGPVTFTGDGDSGISSSNTYAQAIDPGVGDPATINGVTFSKITANTSQDAADYSSTLGFKYTMAPWNLEIAHGTVSFLSAAAAGTGVTSGSGADSLLMDFMYASGYNNSAMIELSKLTAGYTYDARIYYRTWDPAGAQNVNLTFDEDGSGSLGSSTGVINESASNPSAAKYISYQYTATSSPLTINLIQSDIGASWHLYGLTNEVVSVPEPSTVILLLTGLLGLLAYAWRKRK